MKVVIFLLITVLSFLLIWIKSRYKYWINRGFLQHEPIDFLFGNLKGVGVKIHTVDLNQSIYEKFKKKASVVGCYYFWNPVLYVLDLELIKSIFIKDFENFSDRGTYFNAKTDPCSANLFNVHADYWRVLRTKLSPTFTSGKMKLMFNIVLDISNEMVNHVEKNVGDLEMKDILARFTTDVFGNVAFGLDVNSMKEPDSEFREMGRKMLDFGKFGLTKTLILAAMWNITKHLPFRLFSKEINEFFLKTLSNTIKYRESSGCQRNDLLNSLLQINHKEKIDGKEVEVGKLTLNEIVAQCFIFFLGGFETSSAASSFCLYELAQNQEIQEKLRSEIQEVIKKHEGKITYEGIIEMTYLQMALDETLRKYPALENIPRKCKEDYKIHGTNLVIPKDTLILIPVSAIHNDPDLYLNPQKFDIERFNSKNKMERHPMAHIPFGDGPRNCIGYRFGKMQTKLALAQLLSNFKFSVCSKTQIPMEFAFNAVTLSPRKGIWLNVEKI